MSKEAVLEQVKAEIYEALASSATNHSGAERELSRSDLFTACQSANNMAVVSKALSEMKKDGLIKKGINTSLWRIASGFISEEKEKMANDIMEASGIKPTGCTAEECLGADPLIGLIKSMPVPSVADAERKANVLLALAEWPAMNQDVAHYLREISNDLLTLR